MRQSDEERRAPGQIGLVPEATSCERETAEMPVQLPTINRSLQHPVWQDGGRRGHANLLSQDKGAPMDTLSTFQSDYVLHNLPPIPDLRSKVSALVTTADSAPFVPHTENRDNYAPFNMPRVRYRTRRGQIQIPTVPLETESFYKSEYVLKVPERRPAYKPREQNYRPTEPFQNSSIYMDDFKRWESLPSIGLGVNSAHAGPSATAAPRKGPPSAPAADTSFVPDRTLQGQTEYNNYQAWAVSKTASIAPMFRPPKEPFASETSYGTDYGPREKQPDRTPMARPPANDLANRGPFDGVSIYQADFIPKEARPSSRQIYENRSSLMYPAVGRCGLETWYPGAETMPYLEHPTHVFYRA